MTTPRDDIAGLIGRLNDEHTRILDLWEERRKAATQLAALSARVKELEDDITEIPQLLRRAEARATRLQQERDEAYERAAKVAEDCVEYAGYYCDSCKSVSYSPHQASAAIRQLAAGNEKEKKE